MSANGELTSSHAADGECHVLHPVHDDALALPRRRSVWRRAAIAGTVVTLVVVLLAVWGPDGATYEEYVQLQPGMSRTEVEEIIGEGDYWFHRQGEYVVTSWVNDDRTFIRAVFDADDVLVDASWEFGWDASKESRGP